MASKKIVKPVEKVAARPTSIRMPPELAKRLRFRAAEEDKTVTQVVIDVLTKYVKPVAATGAK